MTFYKVAKEADWAYTESVKEHKKKIIPTTADAEKWIDADYFVWKGHIWKIKPDGTVGRSQARTREAK